MTDIAALIEQHAVQFGYRPRATRNLFSGDGPHMPVGECVERTLMNMRTHA